MLGRLRNGVCAVLHSPRPLSRGTLPSMAMVIARVSLPAWIVILAIGAFLAPVGVVTTVLLAALGIACLPVITGGVWKRTSETLAIERREAAAIDTEFTVEDAAPTDPHRG